MLRTYHFVSKERDSDTHCVSSRDIPGVEVEKILALPCQYAFSSQPNTGLPSLCLYLQFTFKTQ